jgi:hypothetical protein
VLSAADLQMLRSEASKVLREIQELPGFAEKLRSLPRLPGERRHWTWRAVLFVCHGEEPRSTSWVWQPASEVASEELVRLAREKVGHSELRGDREFLLVPTQDPKPPAKVRIEVEHYHDKIADFAKRYVLGAEWSARAVHHAVRRQSPVTLPQAPPRPPLWLARSVQYAKEGGQTLSAETAAALQSALAQAETHPEVERYRGRRSDREREVIEMLEKIAAQAPKFKHLADSYQHLQADYKCAEEPPAGAPLKQDHRDAMWGGAIEHVSRRLRSENPPTSTPSSYATRAKKYLNAAVNGDFDLPIPAEPSDAEDYFTRVRPLLRDAERAVQAVREQERSTK